MPDHAVNAPLEYVNSAIAVHGADALTDLLPTSGAINASAATLYDRRVEILLTKWHWNFATRDFALSQLADAPPSPWTAQYNLPACTLKVLGTDIPGEDYDLAANHDPSDTDGIRRLYAMRTGVRARVIVRPLDELFPTHFIDALVADLAAWLSKPITGQADPVLFAEARGILAEAKLIDASEKPTRAFYQRDPRGPSGRRLLVGQDFDD